MKDQNDIAPEDLKQDLEETGPDLKTARESRGMTLNDISKLTKIRVSILKAIENEEFKLLPELIYAKTFIRTYAQALGIGSEKILSRYEKYLEQQSAFREGEIANTTARSGSYTKVFGWVLSVLVVIIFLIFFLYQNHKNELEFAGSPISDNISNVVEEKPYDESELGNNVNRQPAERINTATELKESEIQTIPTEQAAPEQKVEAEDIQNIADTEVTYKLTIEATELTWLKIAVNDNPTHEILLKPGDRVYKEASERFTIDIGNAGGVNVLFQGKSLGILGEHGQVVRLTLPEDIERKR